LGFVVEVMPGDAAGGVALGGEDAVAFAVVLEGLGGLVDRPSVELDRDPLLLPEAVDVVEAAAQGDVGVHAGSWQAVAVDQAEEGLLEVVAGDPDGKDFAAGESSEKARAPASRIELQ